VSTLAKIGLCELAVAGLMGWTIVIRLERPDLLTRAGVKSPRRLLQAHLDYVMMGLILIAVGLALPDIPDGIAVALIFGTLVNPTLFLPLAWDEDWAKRTPYRALSVVSFIAMSGGLVAAAIEGLGR
jgi:hydroxylaminobenzene mutase